jgi:hypothetical protein
VRTRARGEHVQKVHLQRHLESNHGKVIPLSEVKAAIIPSNTKTRLPNLMPKLNQQKCQSSSPSAQQELKASSSTTTPTKRAGNRLEALTNKLLIKSRTHAAVQQRDKITVNHFIQAVWAQ